MTVALMLGCLATGLYFLFQGRPFAALLMALLEGVIISLRFSRLLRVVESEPAAIYLKPDEAPLLFGVVDDAGRQLGVQPPQVIYLGHDCDLFAGGSEGSDHLYIGMPLLYSAGVDEIRALLMLALARHSAREIRLLSRARHVELNCGRWEQKALCHRVALVRFGLTAILSAYAKSISGLSDQLRRSLEKTADARVCKWLPPAFLAQALIRKAVAQHCFNEFWSDACLQSRFASEPHRRIYRLFVSDLKDRLSRWDGPAVRDLLLQENDLGQRLARLSLRRDEIFPLAMKASRLPTPTAAEDLFGQAEPEIRARMEEHWHAAISPVWEQLHRDLARTEQVGA